MMEQVQKRLRSWGRRVGRGAAALALSLAAAGSAMAHGDNQGAPGPLGTAPVTAWAHAPRAVASHPPTGIQPVESIEGRPVLRVVHVVATAYGATFAANYPYGPVDAYGKPLQPGVVAVDPRVIPMRSTLYVTGYHDQALPSGGFVGRALDTGGAIQGNRIDIFISQGRAAVSHFGIEPVTVYVLGVPARVAP